TVERTQLPELAFTRSTRSEEQGLCPSTNNHTFYVWMVFCNQTQLKSPKHVIFGWLFDPQPNFTIFIEITRMRRAFGEEVYYEYR
ncbi:MAG: hypothetical protein IIT43_09805, partial [Clostridia bacterium]|nr:hypothetical protein [Clostridia bacterium]